MKFRHIYHICLALFGVLAVASLYGYFCSQTSDAALVVEEPEQALSGLIVEREYAIDFRLHNRGSRTLRIVGAEFT